MKNEKIYEFLVHTKNICKAHNFTLISLKKNELLDYIPYNFQQNGGSYKLEIGTTEMEDDLEFDKMIQEVAGKLEYPLSIHKSLSVVGSEFKIHHVINWRLNLEYEYSAQKDTLAVLCHVASAFPLVKELIMFLRSAEWISKFQVDFFIFSIAGTTLPPVIEKEFSKYPQFGLYNFTADLSLNYKQLIHKASCLVINSKNRIKAVLEPNYHKDMEEYIGMNKKSADSIIKDLELFAQSKTDTLLATKSNFMCRITRYKEYKLDKQFMKVKEKEKKPELEIGVECTEPTLPLINDTFLAIHKLFHNKVKLVHNLKDLPSLVVGKSP